MKITVSPGKYVVAVSGGVDSMVLLDLLRQKPKLELIVAHFDHGIRPDSGEDRKLVQAIAGQYSLPFVYKKGRLGPSTSEATARDARYEFLRQVQAEHGAKAIITAHHQDDMLETAILNLLRGTGRKGLSSLGDRKDLRRPLLNWTKKDIRSYAREHNVLWREDSTNADERYLRNYIRRNILTRFSDTSRADLLGRITSAKKMNAEIDTLLEQDLKRQPAPDQLNRAWYLQLPYTVAKEVMATWLRRNGVTHFDRTLIDQLVVAAKTAHPGKLADVDAGHRLALDKDKITLESRSRNKSRQN